MSNEFIIAVQVRVIIEGQGCLLVKGEPGTQERGSSSSEVHTPTHYTVHLHEDKDSLELMVSGRLNGVRDSVSLERRTVRARWDKVSR